MDLRFSPADEAFRREAAAWLDEHLSGEFAVVRGAALAVGLFAWFLAQHMRPWLVYALAAPAVLVLVWFGYVYMDRYLPAL